MVEPPKTPGIADEKAKSVPLVAQVPHYGPRDGGATDVKKL